jgi:hypothetical protein
MWGWIREMDGGRYGGGSVMGDRDHKVIYHSDIKLTILLIIIILIYNIKTSTHKCKPF